MKIETNELIGPALDWAVTRAAGVWNNLLGYTSEAVKPYSTSWQYGGPILERGHFSVNVDHSGVWLAYTEWNYADEKRFMQSGPTPLIATMRCFVASELGDEIDIPEELT